MIGDASVLLALSPLLVVGGAACLALMLFVLLGSRLRGVVTWMSALALVGVVVLAASSI
jgi:hypothetical protein